LQLEAATVNDPIVATCGEETIWRRQCRNGAAGVDGRNEGSSGNSEASAENLPQFARPEFSVFQSGVSSSIAVTTHLI